MELHQLKGFVKAAETLNFSEAAKSLCVNQSSFSQYIKQLEYELGANLFERNSHEVTLTEAGEELLPYAKKVVVDLENCKNRMNDLKEMKCGTLNIGVTHSFSMATTETVLEFKKKEPKCKGEYLLQDNGGFDGNAVRERSGFCPVVSSDRLSEADRVAYAF